MKPLIGIALDPNTIVMAPFDWDGTKLLNLLRSAKLGESKYNVEIVRDEEDLIRQEYKRYYDKGIEQGRRTLDMQFLDQLLCEWNRWTAKKPSVLSHGAARFLQDNGCIDGSERDLIALAANPGVFYGAAPASEECQDLEDRAIVLDSSKVGALCIELPDFEVEYIPGTLARIDQVYLSRLFERKVAAWIRKKFQFSRKQVKVNRLLPYLKGIEGGGEVDIYAEDRDSTHHRVVVAECKLRLPGHEGKLLDEGTHEEVSKLVSKYQLINEWELQKSEREGHGVSVFPMLVSNASGITQRAMEVARQNKVKVYRAKLPRDWQRDSEWSIEQCEIVRQHTNPTSSVQSVDFSVPYKADTALPAEDLHRCSY